MRIDMDMFRETFFAEAAEHLETLEAGILRLETAPADRELLNAVFRCAHSIKGASGTFGFTDVARFTHALEGLLDRVRDGRVAVTGDLTGRLLRASDVLGGLVAAAKAGGPPPAATDPVLAELNAVLGEAPPAAGPRPTAPPLGETGPTAYRITFDPDPDLFRQGLDPVHLLRDLDQLGELRDVTPDLSRLPPLAAMDPESCYLGWSARLTTARPREEIEGVFCFVSGSTGVSIEAEPGAAPPPDGHGPVHPTPAPDAPGAGSAAPPSGPPPAAAATRSDRSSIRVPVDKVDKLVNLVEELVVTHSMLNQVVESFTPGSLAELREVAGAMDRNLRDLQERVMAVRMVPIGTVTGRFPRLVRELAAGLGKKIRFEVRGEDTELDKQVIEQIGDPLLHLIRNAADHGIDAPDDRRRAGKPDEGVIRLTASQRGDSVLIEVADDGRGLDLDRIRAKAAARGLVGPADPLTDDATRALVFHPGFSTAETVTDLSGRGVGMDVVKRNIESLNGTVTLSSDRGRGTRVRVKLPLTVAILDGLCLGVGDDVFIVPLLNVIESLRPRRADLKTVLGSGAVLMARGEALPLWPLGRLMGCPARVSDPAEGLVVVVEGDGRRYGLLVDELLGQSQVVIKSLEANYRKVEGVTGATILGDGRVAMILDVHGLLRLANRRPVGVPAGDPAGTPAGDPAALGC